MGGVGILGGRLAQLGQVMALGAAWLDCYVLAACVGGSVAMELGSGMAVGAGHALAVVHVGGSTIITGKFWPYPSAVAEGAGLVFGLGYKAMAVQKAGIDA